MKITSAFFIFLMLGILGAFLYIPNIYEGYRTVLELKKELRSITLENEELILEKNQLIEERKKLNDLYTVEKFARNNLAMKKKDEVIYRVIYDKEKN